MQTATAMATATATTTATAMAMATHSSGYARGAAQISHANTIDDKSRPNLTTNIHNSSGYAGGVAQISQANAVNDKSLPNSSTKLMTKPVPIHHSVCQQPIMVIVC